MYLGQTDLHKLQLNEQTQNLTPTHPSVVSVGIPPFFVSVPLGQNGIIKTVATVLALGAISVVVSNRLKKFLK
jgi:hypothetical protein